MREPTVCSTFSGAGEGRRRALLVGMIVLVTLVAYIPAMRGGFIWDDDLVMENPFVRSRAAPYHFWLSLKSPDYIPVTQTSFWIEWRLWDGIPAGYHVTNVLLHAINAVLLWLALRRLRVPGAWLGAMIFAVHPVNVASVAWISERKNTLSMLFYLLALLFYLRYDDVARRRWYYASLAVFALALLSKTSVVMFPLVLLGCAWWRRRRVTLKDVPPTLPFFALSFVLGLVTVWTQYHFAMGGEAVHFGEPLSRLADSGRAVWLYLYKALVPLRLSMIYPKWQADAPAIISFVPLIALAVTFCVLWRYRRSWGRPLLFGLGYYVVTLLPVLGFFKMYFARYSQIADHWQYLSMAGVVALGAGLFAQGTAWWEERHPRATWLPALFVALLICTLCSLTWAQSRTYGSSPAVWRNALLHNPDSPAVNGGLGADLLEADRVNAAIAQLSRAVRLEPDRGMWRRNLGKALQREGSLDEAVSEYNSALRMDPRDAAARFELGIVLFQQGKPDEAVEQIEMGLRLKPNDPAARYNLAQILVRQGKADAAAEQYRQIIRLDPNDSETHVQLGRVLYNQGKAPEAATEFIEALRIKPDDADALEGLKSVLPSLSESDRTAVHQKIERLARQGEQER